MIVDFICYSKASWKKSEEVASLRVFVLQFCLAEAPCLPGGGKGWEKWNGSKNRSLLASLQDTNLRFGPPKNKSWDFVVLCLQHPELVRKTHGGGMGWRFEPLWGSSASCCQKDSE